MNLVGRAVKFALVGSVVCLLAADIGSSDEQAGQVPVFRARTDLVQLYATVRDANGNPVKGLRADDFAVFDNDKRVILDVVSEVEGRTFEGPEWAREHSFNVASNEPIEDKRLVVIILDDARMSPRGSSREHVVNIGSELIKNLAPDSKGSPNDRRRTALPPKQQPPDGRQGSPANTRRSSRL